MSAISQPLIGKRIGFFGKGGSGKSTVSIILARVLRQAGYQVCFLDADSTNMGTHLALGIEHPPQPLLDYFGGMVFSGGSVTCPVDDPTPLPDAELDLERMPPHFHAQDRLGIDLLTAGKIGALGPGAGCDGPIAKIARDLRVHRGGKCPVMVVDFKAGFEDTARGVFTGLDWLMVVVDPTTASIQIARHMQDMLHRLRMGIPPATNHLRDPDLVALAERLFISSQVKGLLAVLNRVHDAEEEAFLRQALQDMGIPPITCLREQPEVRKAWLRGWPIPEGLYQSEAQALLTALESAEGSSRPYRNRAMLHGSWPRDNRGK
jgi:CO dehydrogenase nickel-insertion accessory protein CooC1